MSPSLFFSFFFSECDQTFVGFVQKEGALKEGFKEDAKKRFIDNSVTGPTGQNDWAPLLKEC